MRQLTINCGKTECIKDKNLALNFGFCHFGILRSPECGLFVGFC